MMSLGGQVTQPGECEPSLHLSGSTTCPHVTCWCVSPFFLTSDQTGGSGGREEERGEKKKRKFGVEMGGAEEVKKGKEEGRRKKKGKREVMG